MKPDIPDLSGGRKKARVKGPSFSPPVLSDRDFGNPGCDILRVSFSIADPREFLSWIRALSDLYGSSVVCFNAHNMAGLDHVRMALRLAGRAMHTGTQISGSFEMEALLYASGSRQCLDAARFGIHEGRNLSYLCICPLNRYLRTELLKEMDPSSEDWEDLDIEKKGRLITLFGITEKELDICGEDRIKEIILERCALLDINK